MTTLKVYILLVCTLSLVGGIIVWRKAKRMDLNESIVLEKKMMKVWYYLL